MNMQQVSGSILMAAKNRIEVLQQTVKSAQLSIQLSHDEYDRREQAALREPMRPAEFASLFPTPPTFAAENAEIEAKQTQIATLTGTNLDQKLLLQQDIDMLNAQKSMKTASYTRNLIKPEGSMTAAQFSALYPYPTHTTDQSTISTAQTEVNKLDSFLKSGPYPTPSSYDVDLLTDTQVNYP